MDGWMEGWREGGRETKARTLAIETVFSLEKDVHIHFIPQRKHFFSRIFLPQTEFYTKLQMKGKGKSLSHVQLFATPWTIQSMEFSRLEYWSGQPFPSPEDLPNPGIKPRSPALQADSLPAEPQGKLQILIAKYFVLFLVVSLFFLFSFSQNW